MFGIISEDNREARIWVVPNRTRETLEPIIVNNVEKGVTVHSDGWAAYHAIDWARIGIQHQRHVHQVGPNLLRRTFNHSNHIEGFWAELKYLCKHIYNTISGSDRIEDYLFEALWRR